MKGISRATNHFERPTNRALVNRSEVACMFGARRNLNLGNLGRGKRMLSRLNVQCCKPPGQKPVILDPFGFLADPGVG